jgi:hypothetical protein
MTPVPQLDIESGSIDESRRRFGEVLGLNGPVPEPVLVAALHDQTYARNLLTCRGTPALLDHLLENPPPVERPSTATLVRGAAEALVRWGRTGFAVVDEATQSRRLSACLECPHLMEPDEHRRLYRAVSGSDRPKVCGLCGCPVASKVRRTSEQCPGDHPERPGFSRWGEPRSDTNGSNTNERGNR